MRRHAGGIGCGARGRERTLLPHSGGAGAPPGGHYEPPARSMATGGRTARRKLRHSGEHGGDNGRQPQSAARRCKEDARDGAP